jgi:hypothetical protein
MAQEVINIGILPNDGTGDTIREAFEKTNNNFDETYEIIGTRTYGEQNTVTDAETITASIDALDMELKDVSDLADGKMTNPMTTAGDIITGGASGTAGRLGIGAAFQKFRVNAGGTAPEWGTEVELMGFAISDETTALKTGEKLSIRVPYAFAITTVYASVKTAPTGSAIQIDVEKGGTSILNAVLEIAATETYAETSTFAAAATSYALAKNDLLTFDIDQIGSTIAGAGAKVILIGYKTSA